MEVSNYNSLYIKVITVIWLTHSILWIWNMLFYVKCIWAYIMARERMEKSVTIVMIAIIIGRSNNSIISISSISISIITLLQV